MQERDLAFAQKNKGLLEFTLLGASFSNEVGRDETTIESHAFGDFQFVIESLAFLNGNDTFLANLRGQLTQMTASFFVPFPWLEQ